MRLEDIKDIPLVPKPFDEIAKKLGTKPEKIISQISRMRKRRFGAVIKPDGIGYKASALVLWRTQNPDHVGKEIAKLDFVFHCVKRPRKPGWEWDIYTLVIARDESELQENIRKMTKIAGKDFVVLKTKRIIKVDTG